MNRKAISRVATSLCVLYCFVPFGSLKAEQTWETIGAPATQPAAPRLNPTGRTFELDSPVQLNRQVIGTLLLTIDADDSLSVDAQSLLSLLEPRLVPAVIAELEGRTDSNRLGSESLTAAGFTVSFDSSRLTLVLEIPEIRLRERVVSLLASSADRSDVVQPATVSGFVNLRVRASHRQSDDNSDVSWRADTDGKLRLGKPVLDFEGALEENSDGEHQWIRRGTRVFYDLPSLTSRVTVGDIFSIGQSFQSSLDILGIGLGRDYQLAPGRNVRPLGRRQFTLNEPSIVSVIIDDLVIRRLELDPGRYDLRDIPLAVGDNAIELLVEGEAGGSETLQFSSVYDSGLLDIGEFDYGFRAGVLAQRTGGSPEYNTDKPAGSAYIRTGVRPWLTASVNVQHASEATLVGTQLLSASAIGPFRLDLAASQNAQKDNGWAANLGFQSVLFGRNRRVRTSFDAEYRSLFFDDVNGLSATSLPDSAQPLQSNAFTASTSTTLQWSAALAATLGYSYSGLHNEGDTTQSVFGTLSGRIRALPRWNWSTRVQWLQTGAQEREVGAFVGLVYRPSRTDSFFSRFESENNELELGLRRRVNTNQLGGYYTEVDIAANQPGDQRARFNAGYTGNRFRALASHISSRAATMNDDIEDDTYSALSSFQLETSLAFAGTGFGFGRPIVDSFALVDAHKTLADRTIRINPGRRSSFARNSWLGAAVVPGLGRYSLKTLSYDVEDLPLGYDLGAGVFAVKPPEGAGYQLTVGSAATVTVVGVLIDAVSSEPFSLITGKVFNLGDPEQEPIVIFTNRTGKFAISGIAPGKYRIGLDGLERSIELMVPEDGATLMRMGQLAVK